MARLIYALNVSLDGYVDHDKFAPDPILFRHFIDDIASVTGSLYGARMYEIMRYWDEDHPGHGPDEARYATAWRAQPKWVVSRDAVTLGPNASRLEGDLATAVAKLKAENSGHIEVAGPHLAKTLTGLGLIDEYRLYFHPVVLGSGRPFFVGPRPPLRLVGTEKFGENVIRLSYVPA